jgi:hypothetical protein
MPHLREFERTPVCRVANINELPRTMIPPVYWPAESWLLATRLVPSHDGLPRVIRVIIDGDRDRDRHIY